MNCRRTIWKSQNNKHDNKYDEKQIAANTARISLVLSRWNLTPTSTPAITMATTNKHVTATITCFRVTRDLSPPNDLPISSAYNLLPSNKHDHTTRTTTTTLPVTMDQWQKLWTTRNLRKPSRLPVRVMHSQNTICSCTNCELGAAL